MLTPKSAFPLGSRASLSWWYANAMMNVWDVVGGTFLLDTELLVLFYRLMGAKVHEPEA